MGRQIERLIDALERIERRLDGFAPEPLVITSREAQRQLGISRGTLAARARYYGKRLKLGANKYDARFVAALKKNGGRI